MRAFLFNALLFFVRHSCVCVSLCVCVRLFIFFCFYFVCFKKTICDLFIFSARFRLSFSKWWCVWFDELDPNIWIFSVSNGVRVCLWFQFRDLYFSTSTIILNLLIPFCFGFIFCLFVGKYDQKKFLKKRNFARRALAPVIYLCM